jgi:hypothetical protein
VGNPGRDLIEVKPKIKTKIYVIICKNDSIFAYTKKDLALENMDIVKKWGTFKAATEIDIDYEEDQEIS